MKAARHKEMLAAIRLPHLVDEVSFDLKDDKGMTGSGLALVNAPYGAENIFSRTREIAAQVLR